MRALAALALGAACTVPRVPGSLQPEPGQLTSLRKALLDLPPPSSAIPIAVYGFTDQTGQYKPSETVQTFSRAVSQGATSVLIQALRDAGQRRWFIVLERERLDNLLKERQVIQEMRQRYLGEAKVNPEALPPMLFAGVLLEGGIIGFDSNTVTGGLGARLLGIGGSVEYRQDTLSVYLRAVATKTGEVLASVVTRKTVASVGADGGVFKFVSFRNLLEGEAGVTLNEPSLVALEQTIQKAVYSLVLAGSEAGTWAFADRGAGKDLIERYLADQGFGEPAWSPTGELASSPPFLMDVSLRAEPVAPLEALRAEESVAEPLPVQRERSLAAVQDSAPDAEPVRAVSEPAATSSAATAGADFSRAPEPAATPPARSSARGATPPGRSASAGRLRSASDRSRSSPFLDALALLREARPQREAGELNAEADVGSAREANPDPAASRN